MDKARAHESSTKAVEMAQVRTMQWSAPINGETVHTENEEEADEEVC